MGNYGSTLQKNGDEDDDNLALQLSRLSFHEQLIEESKIEAEKSRSFSFSDFQNENNETEFKIDRSALKVYRPVMKICVQHVQQGGQANKGDLILHRKYDREFEDRKQKPHEENIEDGTGSSFNAKVSEDENDLKSRSFENLVFEGGGAKAIAYCGAIQYLEEIGLMKKIIRLAGTSAGALFALMLAVGYKSEDIQTFSRKLDEILFGVNVYPFGYWNPLNIYLTVENLISNYGVKTGKRLYDYLGERIQDKGLDPDITFQELLDEKKMTLCIVVTNLNYKSTEYCHPKTTPHMPIRMAARMSMSYPGLFAPVKHRLYKHHDWFVDGGLLCNYPIHCFDGWFLSMENDDAFLTRLESSTNIPSRVDHNNFFREENHKTLGITVNADSDDDVLKWQLEERLGCREPEEPSTKLFKKRAKDREEAGFMQKKCRDIKKSADKFLEAVKMKLSQENETIENKTISLQLLEQVFNDENVFSRTDAVNLFGEDITPLQAFTILNRNKHGRIHLSDLSFFLYESGFLMQEYFYRNERSEIRGLKSYAGSMIFSLLLGTEKAIIHERDLQRTVGINTGYVGTMDFELEDADYQFLIKRGYNGTKAFFDMYE